MDKVASRATLATTCLLSVFLKPWAMSAARSFCRFCAAASGSDPVAAGPDFRWRKSIARSTGSRPKICFE